MNQESQWSFWTGTTWSRKAEEAKVYRAEAREDEESNDYDPQGRYGQL